MNGVRHFCFAENLSWHFLQQRQQSVVFLGLIDSLFPVMRFSQNKTMQQKQSFVIGN